jgi:tetratricopeptide (TPR) repeat protein
LLDQAVFEMLYEHDKYLLLGYWLELGDDVSAAYESVFDGWKRDEQEKVASRLASFLSTAGCYGDFTESLYRRALEGREKALGAEHSVTLMSVQDLGSFLSVKGAHVKGDQDEAESLCRRAMEAQERILGPEHPDTLSSVNSLGMILSWKNEREEAEALHRRALEGREKALGPEHPDTLKSINNLAMVHSDNKEYAEAEALFLRALEGKEKAMGPNHSSTLSSAHNLGFFHQKIKKDYKGAELLFRRALEGKVKALGTEHPATMRSVRCLANLLGSADRFAESLDLLRHYAGMSPSAHNALAYDLACYECLEGHLDEAKKAIASHLKKHPEEKDWALARDALAPIHKWIAETDFS